MKMDVLDKKENPFLKRTDLILMIDHVGQATPKKEEIIKEIAGKFDSSPEKVTVEYIFSEFGLAKAKVKAKVWKEKAPEKNKKMKKTEEGKKEEQPKEETKKEEKKPEEKPKEVKVEKKEEPKKEGEKK
jgi:ribosomal protein S24E